MASSTPTYTDPAPAFVRYYSSGGKWWHMLGYMILLSLGLTFLFCPGCALTSPDFLLTLGYNLCYTIGLWLANGYPVAWLNAHSDWRQEPLRRFLLTIGLSLFLSLMVIVVVNGAFRLFYHHRPLRDMLEPRVWSQFILPLIVTVVISLFIHSRSFLMGWRDAAVRTEQAEKEAAVARLDSLRRQVDPHFLFNSLNALTSLVEEDPTRAVRFIRQLATVYRYVLDSQEQEVVSLAEEVRFAEAYLYLQRTRLGAGLDVQFHLPPAADLTHFLVPPLALQLLLENALKHNATSQRHPLQVGVELDLAQRQLRVRNTLQPRTVAPEESTGLGLKNLQARYDFLSRTPVQIERTATEFVVTLPVLEAAG